MCDENEWHPKIKVNKFQFDLAIGKKSTILYYVTVIKVTELFKIHHSKII